MAQGRVSILRNKYVEFKFSRLFLFATLSAFLTGCADFKVGYLRYKPPARSDGFTATYLPPDDNEYEKWIKDSRKDTEITITREGEGLAVLPGLRMVAKVDESGGASQTLDLVAGMSPDPTVSAVWNISENSIWEIKEKTGKTYRVEVLKVCRPWGLQFKNPTVFVGDGKIEYLSAFCSRSAPKGLSEFTSCRESTRAECGKQLQVKLSAEPEMLPLQAKQFCLKNSPGRCEVLVSELLKLQASKLSPQASKAIGDTVKGTIELLVSTSIQSLIPELLKTPGKEAENSLASAAKSGSREALMTLAKAIKDTDEGKRALAISGFAHAFISSEKKVIELAQSVAKEVFTEQIPEDLVYALEPLKWDIYNKKQLENLKIGKDVLAKKQEMKQKAEAERLAREEKFRDENTRTTPELPRNPPRTIIEALERDDFETAKKMLSSLSKDEAYHVNERVDRYLSNSFRSKGYGPKMFRRVARAKSTSESPNTALQLAAFKGQKDIVSRIVALDKNFVKARSGELRASDFAFNEGYADIAKMLWAIEEQVDTPDDFYGQRREVITAVFRGFEPLDRVGHALVPLMDGSIMITGGGLTGRERESAERVEIWNPKTGVNTILPNQKYSRSHHLARRLADGQVIAVGGDAFDMRFSNRDLSMDFWSKESRRWEYVRLSDFGGYDGSNFAITQPSPGSFTIFPNGDVIFARNVRETLGHNEKGNQYRSITELVRYRHSEGEFELVGVLARFRRNFFIEPIGDKKLYIYGGEALSEISEKEAWDPVSDEMFDLAAGVSTLGPRRVRNSAVLLGSTRLDPNRIGITDDFGFEILSLDTMSWIRADFSGAPKEVPRTPAAYTLAASDRIPHPRHAMVGLFGGNVAVLQPSGLLEIYTNNNKRLISTFSKQLDDPKSAMLSIGNGEIAIVGGKDMSTGRHPSYEKWILNTNTNTIRKSVEPTGRR